MAKSIRLLSPEEALLPLPPSVRAVYQILLRGNQMRITEISGKTPYCHRTVQEALRYLEREGLVVKSHDLTDMRCHFYEVVTT